MTRPVLMLGLDGWSQDIADVLIAQGRMPAFARLKAESACALLDHGDARLTGLAWEHVASGLSPDDARRWSAVDFDTSRYRASSKPTRQRPFLADLPVSAVVFDAPYFDLSAAQNAQGMVSWGAHDPGVSHSCRPATLAGEIEARFGSYPASRYIYGEVWYDPEETRAMANALVRAVEMRAQVTQWLLGERLPGWDLALVVVSELHSAAEALFHGWDESHPLHGEHSSNAARDGIVSTYMAVDRMVAGLIDRFPQARLVAFNLHAMGPNESDPGSMALLAELMYRLEYGQPHIADWPADASQQKQALLRNGWSHGITGLLPRPSLVHRAIRRLCQGKASARSLNWMPAAHYQRFWSRMRAFALPSFYDGRIRVNLAGREGRGKVSLEDYGALLDRIEATLMECRHADRDEPIVARVERNAHDPLDLAPSEADLVVVWNGAPLGMVHPRLGQIGPLPWRRSGGHTGGDGIAFFHGEGLRRGPVGRHDAFDLVPTVVEMLGLEPRGLSGTSFSGKVLD